MLIARQANGEMTLSRQEPPWYGTVCPVVWEDGGREPPLLPDYIGALSDAPDVKTRCSGRVLSFRM